MSALLTLLGISKAYAAPTPQLFQTVDDGSGNTVMIAVVFLILAAFLAKVWMGIMNISILHHETIDKVEKRKSHPYIPSLYSIVLTVACSTGLLMLSLNTVGGIAPFTGDNGKTQAIIFFGAAGMLSLVAQSIWPRAKHYVFALTIGTLVTFILLGFYKLLFYANGAQNPFYMALGIVCVIATWKFLFGPWRPQVKATVLGTFLFWVAMHIIWKDSSDQATARILAAVIALIPAVIWCMLFLHEHKQRLSLVLLMFFAGMLSTAPILFYDAMVRHNMKLQFFLFSITPENFTRSSNAFVSGNLSGVTGVKSTLLITLISFLIVGLIEEVSKFWVLKTSGKRFFTSIDDVLQLGIIVAIGFAFAENVLNPSYFMSFVKSYLINPPTPDWGAFMGNVLGRAILTNMVHILSTGVFAYFYGLALFAGPVLEEEHKAGKIHPIAITIHRLFRIPEKAVYRKEMMIIGAFSSIVLHGLFNFLVTLPDLLPGNPRTLGDVMNAGPESPLHFIALLIIPSLFYVVGGFWILSVLFYKKKSMVERGHLVVRDTFIKPGTLYPS